MSGEERLEGAAAGGMLPGEESGRELLDSVVDVTRRTFAAAACSITVFDQESDELVFTAVAGEGAGQIVGERFSADVGIAGWVLTSQQPIAVDDVERDPRFAAEVAARTGYVPRAIMAAPLVSGERPLGVLSVLDRGAQAPGGLEAMELLSAFASQAAIALGLVEATRRARTLAGGEDPELAVVARLAAAADRLEGRRRRDALALLEALERVLKPD